MPINKPKDIFSISTKPADKTDDLCLLGLWYVLACRLDAGFFDSEEICEKYHLHEFDLNKMLDKLQAIGLIDGDRNGITVHTQVIP